MPPGKNIARNHSRTRIIAALVLALGIVSTVVVLPHFFQTPTKSADTPRITCAGKRKAVIIDGLYDSYPNDTLIELLESILAKKGFNVTIIKGVNANLTVFESLTNYDFIVLRVHGGYMVKDKKITGGIFTGLPWDVKYIDLAREGLVAEGVPVYPPPRGPKVYLALLPEFFKKKLRGSFYRDTIIIAGGCYTALDLTLARVFCEKGAYAYIGFKGEVSLDLLDRLLPILVKETVDIINTTSLSNLDNLNYTIRYNNILRIYICKN